MQKCPRNSTIKKKVWIWWKNWLNFKLKHRNAQKVHFIREIWCSNREIGRFDEKLGDSWENRESWQVWNRMDSFGTCTKCPSLWDVSLIGTNSRNLFFRGVHLIEVSVKRKSTVLISGHKPPGLPLRGRRWGFPPASMNVAPGYFHRKIEEKENQKKPLAIWFPAYLLYLPSKFSS